MRISINTFVGMVVALGVATLGGLWLLAGGPDAPFDGVAVVAFAGAFALVQLLPVPFPRGSQVEMVRVEEAVVVPLALLLGPFEAVVAVAAGVLIGHIATRATSIKAAFNVAQLILAVGAAVALTHLLGGSMAAAEQFSRTWVLSAFAGLAAMFLVNQVLVAGAFNRAGGVPIRETLLDDLPVKLGMWVTNATLGIILLPAAFDAPGLLLLALAPLGMLHLAWRIHAQRMGDEARLTMLRTAVEVAGASASVVDAVEHLGRATHELVDADRVEVRLGALLEPRGIAVVQADEHGQSVCSWEAPAHHAIPPSVVVPLVGSGDALGEVRIWRGATLGKRDRTLVTMLGGQSATALENVELTSRAMSQELTIRQMFDHSSEGLLVLDVQGRVMGWNPAMQSMTGFGQTDVVGASIGLLSPQLLAIVDSAGTDTIDAIVSTSDGARRNVRASFAPIGTPASPGDASDEAHGDTDAPGGPGTWVVVVRDVTRERETERLKDDFVATVSHELRTPLTAIKGFLDTMRRDDVDLSEAQVRLFLEIMGEQSDRLERLINDLLDMSAIESGLPLKVELGPLDVSALLDRTIATFEAAHPGVVIEQRDVIPGIIAHADENRLTQVLTNLLDNGLKHGGRDKVLEASVRLDTSGDRSADPAVVLGVRDQGGGISASDQRRIFDRFYVSADSVTRSGGGAGLGLYISRQLVEAMDGEIDVRSALGEGATFEVRVPLVDRSAPAIPRADAAARAR